MTTARYVLLGWPLDSHLSAAMHNAAFAALGISACYRDQPTPPEKLAAAVDDLRRGALAGANVTSPHKVAIRPLLDDESPLVAAVGAVNTVVRTADGLRGENTDVRGFREALAELGLSPGRGHQAVVLGAGGAARAVVHVLAAEGYAVRILSRSSGQSASVAAGAYRTHGNAVLATGLLSADSMRQAVMAADLLVHATPVGGPADPTACLWPVDGTVPGHLAVMDLVPWPAETRLMTLARDAGCLVAGGRTMLLHQAAEAFRLWTRREAPLDVMAAALDAALAAHSGPDP